MKRTPLAIGASFGPWFAGQMADRHVATERLLCVSHLAGAVLVWLLAGVTDYVTFLCLSALYGQAGKIDEVVKLLAPHEALMQRDVRIAHNYFEALFQLRDLQKITGLLNKLATSQVREVKQFAIERSRAISQLLQQQQQQLAQAAQLKV